jgi:predicted Zn-dependent protease
MKLIHVALWLMTSTLACAAPQHSAAPARTPNTDSSPSAVFARAQTLAANGDHARAEQYLILAIRLGYPEERAIGALIQVCVASSRLRAALDHAEPFLKRHPEAWQLRYLVASIQLALGNTGEAVEQLERVIRARPNAPQAHYLLAVVARDVLRDNALAGHSFEAYVAHDPHGRYTREAQAWLAEHAPPSASTTAGETADEERP